MARDNQAHLEYLLTAYLFENLSAAGKAEVEAHLAQCAECRAELESLRRTLGQVETALAGDGRKYVFEEHRRARVLATARSGKRLLLFAPLRMGWKFASLVALLFVAVLVGLVLPVLSRARGVKRVCAATESAKDVLQEARGYAMARNSEFSGNDGLMSNLQGRLDTPPVSPQPAAAVCAPPPPSAGKKAFAEVKDVHVESQTTHYGLLSPAKTPPLTNGSGVHVAVAGTTLYEPEKPKAQSSDIVVPPGVLAKAEMGDHFETINPDEPAGGGGNGGASLDDVIGVGGAASPGTGGGWGGVTGAGAAVDRGEAADSFGDRSGGVRASGVAKTKDKVIIKQLDALQDSESVDGEADGDEPTPGMGRKDVAIAAKDDTIRRQEALIAQQQADDDRAQKLNSQLSQQNAQLAEHNAMTTMETRHKVEELESLVKDLGAHIEVKSQKGSDADKLAAATTHTKDILGSVSDIKPDNNGPEEHFPEGTVGFRLDIHENTTKDAHLTSEQDVAALKRDIEHCRRRLDPIPPSGAAAEEKALAGKYEPDVTTQNGGILTIGGLTPILSVDKIPSMLNRTIVAPNAGKKRLPDYDVSGEARDGQPPTIAGGYVSTAKVGRKYQEFVADGIMDYQANPQWPNGLFPTGGGPGIGNGPGRVQDGKFSEVGSVVAHKTILGKMDFANLDPVEKILRGYLYFSRENPALTLQEFSRRPASVPPAALTDGGLDEDDYIERFGTRPFVDCARDHESTFGMDVDTASYTRARACLQHDQLPDPQSVRVEEFVNYFKQPYTVPADETFGVFAQGGPSLFGAAQRLDALKIGIKSRQPRPDERKPANLTFVIDTSGSMAHNLESGAATSRIDLIRRALAFLVEQLRPDDAVSIVAFNGKAELVLPRTAARYSQRILDALQTLSPDGGTNVEAGLSLGYKMADEAYSPDAVNRVILCSDGVANSGASGPDELLKQVKLFAARGIDLCTVGFGSGQYNDAMMQRLADSGNGSSHYIDNLEEARRVFTEQLPPNLNVLARDAKVQVEFNPEVVARYRLLGYEKRKIADKDFRNDKIDSGEVNHDTLVTALYLLERKPQSHGPLGKVFLRWKDAGYRNLPVVERNYPLPEGVLSGDVSSTPANVRFLECVAQFAELLRGSRWAQGSSYAAVLEQLCQLPPELQRTPECQEVLSLVIRAQLLTLKEWTGTK